ncbi:MAG: hypothetical protein ACC657_14280 [Thiohalomonadales bacterium]
MLLTLFLIGSLLVFVSGYYLGHQIGGTAHIRSQLNTGRSEQLTTHGQT